MYAYGCRRRMYAYPHAQMEAVIEDIAVRMPKGPKLRPQLLKVLIATRINLATTQTTTTATGSATGNVEEPLPITVTATVEDPDPHPQAKV